jgi:hypothetical protein
MEGRIPRNSQKCMKDKKMKNPIEGKMIQRYVKETMKKRRSRKAQASTNKRHKKNNLTRIEIRNPLLTRRPPFNETLLLDQILISQLLQLLLLGGQNRPGRCCGPHGKKFLVLDYLKNPLLVLLDDLIATRCPRVLALAHKTLTLS